MAALSALPKTDAPATRRRMSRPDAGLAMIPTVGTDADTLRRDGLRHGCAGRTLTGGLDPFIAIDAGTDVRAHARSLRRVWESALDGGALRPRAVIAQSWSRLRAAGLDPARLKPNRALDEDGL